MNMIIEFLSWRGGVHEHIDIHNSEFSFDEAEICTEWSPVYAWSIAKTPRSKSWLEMVHEVLKVENHAQKWCFSNTKLKGFAHDFQL